MDLFLIELNMCKKEKCERETKNDRDFMMNEIYYPLLKEKKKKKKRETLSAHVEKLYSSHSRSRHLSTIPLKDCLLFKIVESAYDKKNC